MLVAFNAKHSKLFRPAMGLSLRLVETLSFNWTKYDPESDSEGEAPKEAQALQLHQGVSERLVTKIMCLDTLLFVFFLVLLIIGV